MERVHTEEGKKKYKFISIRLHRLRKMMLLFYDINGRDYGQMKHLNIGQIKVETG